ncbi:hypothetical protein EIP91_002260 [Steccherinum ochraceum]|uniref:Uncharacterized protein n=1 Tax=Steccherinum ochraceum TaxID=92696 RepID=A0A4R0RCJ3_9APHY|nr:hypothetical protein EIP91_002260 [Steccherinum ochraceum]
MPPTAEDVAQATACEVEAIAVHECNLQRLKQHRNTLASINVHLPPEILSIIFVHLVYDLAAPWPAAPTQSLQTALSWVKSCTHVCQRWRSIALHTPEMWTFIFFNRAHESVSAAHTFLSRSGGLPLYVTIKSLPILDLSLPDGRLMFIEPILNELHRVQELGVANCFNLEERLVLKDRYGRVPTPLLRHLYTEDGFLWQSTNEELPLDSDYPRSQMPCLQTVDFTPNDTLLSTVRVFFPPTLTSILLRNNSWQDEVGSMGPLVSVLRTTPLLQCLEVSLSSTRIPGAAFAPVHLNHLRKLIITSWGDNRQAAWFMRSLIHPTSTRIHYGLLMWGPGIYHEPVLTHLDENLRRFDYDAYDPNFSWPFSALFYEPIDFRVYKLLASENSTDRYHGPWRATKSTGPEAELDEVALSFHWRIEPVTLCPFLEEEFKLPTTGIRALFWGGFRMRSEAGHSYFEHMQQVETLLVQACQDSQWLWSSNVDVQKSPSVPFPKLRVLIVLDCSSSLNKDGPWWQALQTALAARTSAGLPPIEKIAFEATSETLQLPQGVLEWMREHCVDVITDATSEWVLSMLQGRCPVKFVKLLDQYFKGRESTDDSTDDEEVED